MKTTELKLEKIETTKLMTKIAHLELTLDKRGENITVKLATAGHLLNITSSHNTGNMRFILDWLEEASSGKNNLRTNESEIIIFAKEMLKANEQLKEIKTF